MKKQILIGLISVSSILSVNAQTWTGSSDVNGNLWRNGNVGIGITDPKNKLEVAGDVKISNYSPVLILQRNTNTGGFIQGIQTKLEDNTNSWFFGTAHGQDWRICRGDYQDINAKLVLLSSGMVGIGTVSPAYKLDVCGTIRAKEVVVNLLGGCDFVFKSDYKLMDLKKLEEFVKTNQHLPEIASEKEMVENGVNMKDLQMKLLQKMEEMTLYMIEQNKKLEQQNEKIMTLENEIKELKTK